MITIKDLRRLEKIALNKYEDLLDTILVLEAMKAQTQPGKEWKELKKKLMKREGEKAATTDNLPTPPLASCLASLP